MNKDKKLYNVFEKKNYNLRKKMNWKPPKEEKKHKEMTKKEIEIQKITIQFIEKYFCEENYKIEEIERYWIAGAIGSILSVNDYFFSYEVIYYCVQNNVNKEIFFNWYHLVVVKDIQISLQDYSEKFNF
jgi:hypothetical protein